MHHGLQHGAADGASLVRYRSCVGPLASGVDVTDLEADGHLNAIAEQPPHHTGERRDNGGVPHMGDHIPLLHQITELDNALHHPGDRGAHHPAGGVSLDHPGNAGIGLSRALIDDPAQMMTAVGLNDRIAVAPRLKPRAKGHRNGGHLLVSA